MRKIRLFAATGVAAVAGVLTLGVQAPSQAIDGACRNQPGDVSILGLVGVDQYDPPPSGNGIIAVCHPAVVPIGHPLLSDTYSGVRVAQDSNGTCVAVIIERNQVGCSFSIEP